MGGILEVCGTWGAYQQHLLAGERPCADCAEANRIRSRERYAAGYRTPGKSCELCGKYIDRTSAYTVCRVCRKAEKWTRSCAVCGVEFLSIRKSDGNMTQTCSFDCGTILRWGHEPELLSRSLRQHEKNANRRKNILKDSGKQYTLAEIAERDGFVCQLCLDPVDMSLSGMERWGPTIDHAVPLVVSRDDRRANVQLAHRVCNGSKGANLAPLT
jgi:hypothetical protein